MVGIERRARVEQAVGLGDASVAEGDGRAQGEGLGEAGVDREGGGDIVEGARKIEAAEQPRARPLVLRPH